MSQTAGSPRFQLNDGVLRQKIRWSFVFIHGVFPLPMGTRYGKGGQICEFVISERRRDCSIIRINFYFPFPLGVVVWVYNSYEKSTAPALLTQQW